MKYLTIAAPSEAVFTEQRSKFLSFAFPVDDAEEAKAVAKDFSKKYFDARHVCWAYMIGVDRTNFLSTDNGEPSGTAGKPILGQINSFGLTNIVIIVVRYFGGIKLGTSGLISAYRQSAKLAIEAAEIIECDEVEDVVVQFPFESMNGVMKVIKSNSVKVKSQEINNLCKITIVVPLSQKELLQSQICKVEGVSFD